MTRMSFRTVLLLLTLMQVTRGFSNSGGSCIICHATNDNLSKNLLSNALRSSRNPKKNAFPRASSTLSTSLNVIGSSTKTVKASGEVLSALRDRLLPVIMSKLDRIYIWNLPKISILSLSETFVSFLRKYWWLSPMSLVLIPLYCAIFKGTCAAMPDWWNVVPMDHIAAADNSQWIIGHFLASNISYFASGAYLMLKRFPLIRKMKTGGIKVRLTRFSMLGMWIFLAGAISTVFHSIQALGSYPLSQSLCYVDHAVAGSAFCYFLETCGSPSRRVWSVGSAALLTLVVTSPGYTFLHSFWHYLSAATATLWALEGYARLIPSRTGHTK
ncbi:hypothetical protein IV203_029750 [Nitzschia inconspicua]|uniref:Post-GPI attachment to proteins factor 3 n=1 Tax=Nitzschia inconspicua TaxID=303405 RepID=A0A9K3P8W6_9STRA|nr:hypothetical protein IV203_004832 [Nitzschia inconspicua]KAG7367080.1 hypothetical protein IV203_029750 [Nitzschia inconspicua]